MTNHFHDDDALEQTLRTSLGSEADGVEISGDGLARIRSRTAGRRGWLAPAGALAAAAGLTGVVALGVVTLAGGDDGDAVLSPASPSATSSPSEAPTATPSAPVPSGSPTALPSSAAPAPASPSPSPAPPAAPSPSAAPPIGTLDGVPVYWVHDSGQRVVLFREFRSLPDEGGAVTTAVAAMLRGSALDPDYGSLWAAGTRVLSTSVSGDVVTVDLSAEARTTGGGSEAAAVTVQQLVWTATAAAQVPTARFLIEGQRVGDFWGAVSVDDAPIAREPAWQVLAPVWIETPRQGATVGSPVTFGGSATVFEATVSWQVLRGGTVVAEGFDTASEGAPGRGTWSATVTLPPGAYVLKAFESSARDGSETYVETKDVTVR